MADRVIKESTVTSEPLSEISAEAERLFWRLVVKADDFG
ncbi:MAG: transcriptional regulator, partial [Clostridiales bacterium]